MGCIPKVGNAKVQGENPSHAATLCVQMPFCNSSHLPLSCAAHCKVKQEDKRIEHRCTSIETGISSHKTENADKKVEEAALLAYKPDILQATLRTDIAKSTFVPLILKRIGYVFRKVHNF